MKIPQAIENPVKKVLNLFRRNVIPISLNISIIFDEGGIWGLDDELISRLDDEMIG